MNSQSIANGINSIKQMFNNLANSPTGKSAPDKTMLQKMTSCITPVVIQKTATEVYIPDVILIGDVYCAYEVIGKNVESGSEETLVSADTSEDGSASFSSEHTQTPVKNKLLTPVKEDPAVLSAYEDRTISGTPVSIAKKFAHKVDLNTPENPNRNLRPRDLDGRHGFSPVTLNLNQNLSSDEYSSD